MSEAASVDRLASLPEAVLVIGWVVIAVALAFAARAGVRRLVPASEHDQALQIAAPLMPALGAAFGILMALTVASEAGYLKSTQEIVAGEAAAASRLAWAATTPDVQTADIHDALVDYLETTTGTEWDGDDAATGSGQVAVSLATLERVVRAQAASADLSTPQATELLAGLDTLTSERRSRLAAAARHIPLVYVITLIVSGFALIANAGALGVRASARTSALVLGLAIVVGLSLALMFSLTAPWQGALTVSTGPIDSIIEGLHAGSFH